MKKAVYGVVTAASVAALAFGVPASLGAQDLDYVFSTRAADASGPTIGVTVEDGDDAGARVTGVAEGTPAARAGIAEGDVVVEFDGERVRSAQQFGRLVRETAPGRAVNMTVLREGARRQLEVSPEERSAFRLRRSIQVPGPAFAAPVRPNQTQPFSFWVGSPFGNQVRLGVSVAPVSGQLAEFFGVTEGVLVQEVVEGSPAARAGLRAGDVIQAVDGSTVTTAAELVSAVGQADDGAELTIRIVRDRQETTVTATLPERARPFVPATQVSLPV